MHQVNVVRRKTALCLEFLRIGCGMFLARGMNCTVHGVAYSVRINLALRRISLEIAGHHGVRDQRPMEHEKTVVEGNTCVIAV
jgi:hypothetical protein